MTTPRTELDTRFSDPAAQPTSWEDTLQAIKQAEIFWISTVRTDGRPHVIPLVAVWIDDALHFSTGPDEQKARNLTSNPRVALTTGAPKVLTLHADRGSAMRSKPVAFLLADLGITKTHSRPYTSSDNPYSESNFKTVKYRPEFPERFDDIEHARAHCRTFFHWYNHEHRHSGIGLMTPAAIHHGHAEHLHAARASVLEAAFTRNPERFVRKPPTPSELPTAAWINKPETKEVAH